MTDVITKTARSVLMSKIRSKNTLLEIRFRQGLWASGIRGWRLHSKKLPGKPDLFFSKKKIAIFIDGCFWHGCPKCYRKPKSNLDYWNPKIRRNKTNDRINSRKLIKAGWHVVRVWEHDVNENLELAISKISILIRS